jgi:hypothetical protein
MALPERVEHHLLHLIHSLLLLVLLIVLGSLFHRDVHTLLGLLTFALSACGQSRLDSGRGRRHPLRIAKVIFKARHRIAQARPTLKDDLAIRQTANSYRALPGHGDEPHATSAGMKGRFGNRDRGADAWLGSDQVLDLSG